MYNNLFPTPQEAHYIFVKKTNRLSISIEDTTEGNTHSTKINKYNNRQTQAGQGNNIVLQYSR
jgi:hypothetical protein